MCGCNWIWLPQQFQVITTLYSVQMVIVLCMYHPTPVWPTPSLHDIPHPCMTYPHPTPPLYDPPPSLHDNTPTPTSVWPTPTPCMTYTIPIPAWHTPTHPIPPLEHFWEEHPWISWAASLSLPFGRQLRRLFYGMSFSLIYWKPWQFYSIILILMD